MSENQTSGTSKSLPSAEAIQVLLDKSALYELVQNYCRAVDRRDFALLESLYHPDSTDNRAPMFSGSGPDFVRWVPSITQRFVVTSHVVIGALFTVAGDIADGEVHIVAYHLSNKEPMRETISHGRYLDRYERRDGVWRILERTTVYDWSEARAYDKELFARISRGSVMGQAGENDPLYSQLKLVRRGIR